MRREIIYNGYLLAQTCADFGYIVDIYLDDVKYLQKVAEVGKAHGLLDKNDLAFVEYFSASLKDVLSESFPVIPPPRSSINMQAEMSRLMSAILFGGQPIGNIQRDLALAKQDLEAFRFMMQYKPETVTPAMQSAMNNGLEYQFSVEALLQELVLQPATNIGFTSASSPRRQAASATFSLPESISRERRKMKKPKANPDDPDAFYPWSQSVDIPPTERSDFRSHAKMSAVSPFPTQQGPEDLPPLPEKKRTQLLKELREACAVMKDAILMERFDRMKKKRLQLIVKLGKGEKNKRCYYVRSIYDVWMEAAKGNTRFSDPLTREPLSQAEKDDIMRKIRYVAPRAQDPRTFKAPKDPKLKLVIQQQTYTIDGQREPVPFYAVKIERPIGIFVSTVYDLGLIPAHIESDDVEGAANLTSNAVIATLKQLFEQGSLLINNVMPYKCCRVELKKDLKYWTTRRSPHERMVHGININRFKALATDIYNAL